MGSEVEGNWDIVITSLQDIRNSSESLTFDSIYAHLTANFDDDEDHHVQETLVTFSTQELNKLEEEIIEHKANIATAKRLIDTSCENLQSLIESLQRQETKRQQKSKKAPESKSKSPGDTPVPSRNRAAAAAAAAATAVVGKAGKAGKAGKSAAGSNKVSDHSAASNGGSAGIGKKGKKLRKVGRSFWQSKYNPHEPIYVGSEVAFKLRNRVNEWIQCEVVKIIGDGVKFEIRDPEPDENNNPGQTFRANYKEVLLIPPDDETARELPHYAYGTKVLARYPDTTTYYAAIVVGHRKDGNVRLKFDGEEEVNKETEVTRRLVLPLPQK